AWFAFEPKAKERTTVTAHNKAQGHVEPNWTADQRNNTGVYADLTPEEKLALNIKEQRNYPVSDTPGVWHDRWPRTNVGSGPPLHSPVFIPAQCHASPAPPQPDPANLTPHRGPAPPER